MRKVNKVRRLRLETLEQRALLSASPNTSTVTFEDLGASLPVESYWNGSDSSGGFTSGDVDFNNNYNAAWSSWDGWAYSNMTDTTSPGYTNQYSAYSGSGAAASTTYAVAYASVWAAPPSVSLPAHSGLGIESLQVTNTTYAALSMLQGDAVGRRFGYLDANDDGDYDDVGDYNGSYADWFMLTITGKDAADASLGQIDVYLADYRFADSGEDYVLDDWISVDLTPLGGAQTLEFSLSSSDVGDWGMNTPAYFAADNITLYDPRVCNFEDVGAALTAESHYHGGTDGDYVFESGQLSFDHHVGWSGSYWDQWTYSNHTDTTTAGYTNQFSAYLTAPNPANTYAVAFSGMSGGMAGSEVTLDAPAGLSFESIDVTNTTYAALSMLDGDDFASPFGWFDANDDGDYSDPGDYTGAYPDWFLLTVEGHEGIDGTGDSVGTVDFYLADYRFEDDAQDYVIDDWTTIDLTSLKDARSLVFTLTSSDVGTWGMNTPAYFAADNITVYQSQVVSLDASESSDVITFTTNATQHVVTINGTPHTFDRAQQIDFLLDGLDGTDQITIYGTDGNEEVVLQPGSVDVDGPGYSIHAVNVETIHVDAGTGDNDRVTLSGSTGSNRLYSYADYATLADSTRSYSFRAEGFDTVTAEAPGSGRDYAFLYDSPQDDLLDADPAQVVFTRSVDTVDETVTTADGFQRIYVYATQDGNDTAELTGSDTARNRFYGYADYSILTESRRSFYFYARGFDDVTASSPSSVSTYAYLYDSSDVDSLSATPGSATMDRADTWSDTTAAGFKRVYAYSSRGGADTATLTGSSTGGNRYRGYPTYSTLTDTARSFYHYARGFSTVTAIGSQTDTSSDRAYLYDSNGADTLVGSGNSAILKDTAEATYQIEALYFDLVYARSSDGAANDTLAVDEALLAYELIRSGTW